MIGSLKHSEVKTTYLKNTVFSQAALSALTAGLITHLFGLVTPLHNYDDIAQLPGGYGTGITSGRWLLSLLGDLAGFLGMDANLPVVNGLLFLILIAVSAGLAAVSLQIKRKGFAVAIGALFAVFPTAASTLAFRYTAVYYGIGILMAVAAAWCLDRFPFGFILSALLTACSLGIYQAYVPMTISLFVLQLMGHSMRSDASLKNLIYRGFRCCGNLILGLIFYWILLQICLRLYGTQLSNYQGMDQMGSLTLSQLPSLVKEAIYSLCIMPLRSYCNLADLPLIRISYWLLAVSSIGLIGWFFAAGKNKLNAFFALTMVALMPLAVNFIVVMCPESYIYTLMVYSFVFVPCLPMVMWERLEECQLLSRIGKLLSGRMISWILAIMIGCYGYQTNASYATMYYTNRQIENYLSTVIAQVRMTDGFRADQKWVFLGEFDDPLLNTLWQYEFTLGGTEDTVWMLRRYSWYEWIHHYYGYRVPMVSQEATMQVAALPEVAAMACWPNSGSIQIINDQVVIKLQPIEEINWDDVF